MVFSSLPIFLDPPNWSQQTHQCLIGGGGSDHHQLIPPPAGLAAPPACHADVPESVPASSSSLPTNGPRAAVSMAERARLARVPLPDPGTLRCPRCDSTNTKFCYFNNYSLSQPRHFCKACRRYWTRGGALRNVPVGGGCRRNTKRSSKKSSRQGGAGAATSSSSTTSTTTSTTAAADAVAMQALPHLGLPEAALEGYHQMPFMQSPLPYHQGLMYPFADGDVGGGASSANCFVPRVTASGLLAQLASVKMEEHGGSVGVVGLNEQYWGGAGGGWPGEFLSGFSSSSSGNVL